MTQQAPVQVDVESEPPRRAFRQRASGRSLLIRSIAVAIFDALVVVAIPQMVANDLWTLLVLMVGAAIAVNWAYLSPRANASKWLTPGLILMAIFVIYPVIYTTYVSLTNWQTGNQLTKEQSIANLESQPIESDEAAVTLDMRVYQDSAGAIAFLISGEGQEAFVGVARPASDTETEGAIVDTEGIDIDPANPPETIGDFQLLSPLELAPIASELEALAVDLPDGRVATVDTFSSVSVSAGGQRFVYDPDSDTLTDNQNERTCVGGEGVFLCDDVPEDQVAGTALNAADSTIVCSSGVCDQVPHFSVVGDGDLPGWRTVIGFNNYAELITNQAIRAPFFRVLVWNLFFAAATVILTFAMGLGLAIALQDSAMKGRNLYRSIYILPYAIPAFLSVFVWRGLLNEDFGQVNELLARFGLPSFDWLGDPWLAMFSVLMVNLWLGFPYMFLIATGALTSVPDDLLEAGRIDGAGKWGLFRGITLPLILISTAPLLIGSFAFNFNNFVLIYLLNNGGPPLTGYEVPVGATDILLSFTFNLASGAGRGSQFALASAIIVVIFVFLAIVSAASFRLTKRLEDVYGG